MTYFDNTNWLNLDYFFNLIFRVVYFIPELIFNAFLFWTGATDSLFLKFLFATITIASLGVIFYSIYKTWLLNQANRVAYLALFAKDATEKEEKKIINEEWVDIMDRIESTNPSNWVMAIIECDKILDELLRERGFDGKDIGEMLKSDKGKNLRTLQDAWEGHKIRNRIAHEPGFVLENREAKVATAHYESVFRELGFLPAP
ncbi:MAG: hypothetical protein UR85_C0011G0002 [Candidatus Nomurabacteria bacterium GW2011_GWF2_35_66]|nr:MAG: hypothetical protein UR85_C0011G0002 [Candidatus Nomurabacteria bacterium GW2011_GWF2_35_66]HBM45408.1 hypothetical protein [Patescibacteria group bacterium]